MIQVTRRSFWGSTLSYFLKLWNPRKLKFGIHASCIQSTPTGFQSFVYGWLDAVGHGDHTCASLRENTQHCSHEHCMLCMHASELSARLSAFTTLSCCATGSLTPLRLAVAWSRKRPPPCVTSYDTVLLTQLNRLPTIGISFVLQCCAVFRQYFIG